MDPLQSIARIAASGMTAQTARLRVISENVANAESTGTTPGADPFRRKTISFSELVDRNNGASMVEVGRVGRDQSDFRLDFDPSHPAADETGYVKRSNVDPIIEMANMREASRNYEANMNMFEAGRRMRGQMLDLLK
ncbi:flagellar basal body rod protein FlgC [Sulfitobacter sp. CW3]|jgi:flagellar basal-body rod protein FlgC|uniref:flagellar basal body rod protein FlgC n=1 Tax=Sulfitobacter sp. CW3 TaxID=2861965 RepID=UPI001C5DB3BC|nr:flagellar basal body rod protein FlgC [Sulfitobacter sp. CW3]MBW4961630.1 flagellar basal body rod protein FlgC [Sulfitobacter sp. CW3]|tara:strand:- start:48657 stop:49067 length:411 start_codon:yes stop_codon:yes gene_type:complete